MRLQYLYSNVKINGQYVPQMNYRFDTKVTTEEGITTNAIDCGCGRRRLTTVRTYEGQNHFSYSYSPHQAEPDFQKKYHPVSPLKPTVVKKDGQPVAVIKDGDSVVFFNVSCHILRGIDQNPLLTLIGLFHTAVKEKGYMDADRTDGHGTAGGDDRKILTCEIK